MSSLLKLQENPKHYRSVGKFIILFVILTSLEQRWKKINQIAEATGYLYGRMNTDLQLTLRTRTNGRSKWELTRQSFWKGREECLHLMVDTDLRTRAKKDPQWRNSYMY